MVYCLGYATVVEGDFLVTGNNSFVDVFFKKEGYPTNEYSFSYKRFVGREVLIYVKGYRDMEYLPISYLLDAGVVEIGIDDESVGGHYAVFHAHGFAEAWSHCED